MQNKIFTKFVFFISIKLDEFLPCRDGGVRLTWFGHITEKKLITKTKNITSTLEQAKYFTRAKKQVPAFMNVSKL